MCCYVSVDCQYVLCCRMDGRLPKTVKVPQQMIVIVLKVSRYVVVVVICLIYVVL